MALTRLVPRLFVALSIVAPAALFAAPALPAINTSNIIVITNVAYGAKGDNSTDNTLFISNAILAASKGGRTNGLYGGTVEIPAGTNAYLCGPIAMANNVNLQLDAGAILRLLPYASYPGGIVNPPDFLTASSLTNLEISGSGAIDGQGSPWWPGYKTNSRPYLINFSGCNRVLFQNATISNAPAQNIVLKGKGGNITLQNITVLEPASSAPVNASHNTDAIDLVGTNCLVQNCYLSVGDDNIALGTSSSGTPSANILVTNCAFGTGHGLSIGSNTQGGVSNLTVINCTFNGTDNGIRMKSDNHTSGGSGEGGITQNLSYFNLGMTNVNFPFLIYSYYSEIGTPSSISPYSASTQLVETVTSYTPLWRNITFSNINATSVGGYPIGLIWARPEMPATNIVFNKVNVSGDRNFELYNVSGAQFIDCNFTVSATSNTFALFNAQVIITNSAPTNTLFTFDGLTTNGYGNSFALYNAAAALQNTNAFDNGPLTLASGILTISNNLTLFPSTVLNYTLGTNAATVSVAGHLTLGGTINVTAGSGFTNGAYTLFTYTGALNGSLPTLAATPTGYNYNFDTNTAGLVKLTAVSNAPQQPAPTNLVAVATNLAIRLAWNAATGATTYNLKRGTVSGSYPSVFTGLTATNYTDAGVTNAVTYYYVVSAVGAAGESTNSAPASATPLPSKQPTNVLMQVTGSQLQLSWPQDHLGWRLQIQTNDLTAGLSTNWATVANSTNVMTANISVSPTNGSVFLRLVYP